MENEDEFPSSSRLAEAVGAAARVKSHLEKDIDDQCAYCGQLFGPDEVIVERNIYGRGWKFCDEVCLTDFQERSNFKDENLDHPDRIL